MRNLRQFIAVSAVAMLSGSLALLTSSRTPASASAYPTPQPTAIATSVPANIVQSQVIAGCYHNSNGNCPSPSANGQVADWQYIATRISYVRTDARAYGLANQAGIYSFGYTDPVYIHGSTTVDGSTLCPSDQSPLPINIMSRMQDFGETAIAVNGAQSPCSTSTAAPELGDISKPQAFSFWERVYKQNNAFTQAGASSDPYFATGLKGVEIDDWLAEFINSPANGSIICQGPGHLTTGGTQTNCSNVSPFSTQITQDIYPFVYQSYPNPIPDWYLNGSRSFFRSWRGLNGAGVFVNDITDPWLAQQFVGNDADHANITAGMCENCFTRNPFSGGGTNYWNENTWLNHVNAEATLSSRGVGFWAFNPSELSQADQTYTYVSLGLGMMDANRVFIQEQCTGALSAPSSGICIAPIALIVPTQPLNDPAGLTPNWSQVQGNSISSPTNVGVSLFKHNGFYSREFKACYNNQVLIGACAYVINPTSSSATITGLSGTYTHEVSYTGTGILTATGFGDTYTISTNTTSAATSLAANTAQILTP